jgi:histidine kinase
MRRWQQLRVRLVLAMLAVVVVGVVTLLVAQRLLLAPPAGADTAPDWAGLQAAAIAAAAALTAGLLFSVVLMRQILRPLDRLAYGTQRIAHGHYDERLPLPNSAELAAVAESFNQMAGALASVEQQRVALIGDVAHELRTPLAGLEGYVEALIDGVLPASAENFAAMQAELRRLRRLVEDLQTLSRVEIGQVNLHPQVCDLAEIGRRVVTQLLPQATGLGISLGFTDGPALPAVYADPDRVAQILVNLIGNGLRYTPSGGSVTVVGWIDDDGTPGLAVSDTGIGIAAAQLSLVFERFFRADPSRARSSGGSGIGLTIARHLAWAMGGDLRAASAGAGRGSTFTLTLPAHHARL